jgi:hypothetical protein
MTLENITYYKDDKEAADKIMAPGKIYAKAAHPDMPSMSDQQMKDMFKAGMKKA